MDQMPLTSEWTERCVMLETRSGHLAMTLHCQSTRKKCCDWTWKCKHWSKSRITGISIIVREFFGDPIVPYGKISGTGVSSSGTAGYVRKLYIILAGPHLKLSVQWAKLQIAVLYRNIFSDFKLQFEIMTIVLASHPCTRVLHGQLS